MAKDKRYRDVKRAWKAGLITLFSQILTYVPSHVLCQDLDVTPVKLAQLMDRPDLLTVTQVVLLSYLIGITDHNILELIMKSVDEVVFREP